MEQAYPGKSNKQLRDKCTYLQRYGQKYSLLETKGLVLSPLRGTSSKSVYPFSRCAYKLTRYSFERAEIKTIEMEALVAIAEDIFNEKHQNELQMALECILNTCPFKPTSRSNLRLPSKSTRRRLRKRAARIMDTQKPLTPLTSPRNLTRITPNLNLMHLRHSLDFDFSGPQPGHFSSLENLVEPGKVPTRHAPDSKSIQEASEEILSLQIEARNAARITSQAALQQEMESRTRVPWNNNIVSSAPMALYSSGGQISIPVLLDSHQEPENPCQFPVYDPLDDSALDLAPSKFPIYDPLDDSARALAPQFPVYDAHFAESSRPSGLVHPKNPAQGSVPLHARNHDPDGVHYDYTINHLFPVTLQI